MSAMPLMGGCAGNPSQRAVSASTTAGQPDASSALVFDPPVTLNVAPLDLSRDTRGSAAFYGFEDSATTYYDTYTDDRRTTDGTNRLTRETYSETAGDLQR